MLRANPRLARESSRAAHSEELRVAFTVHNMGDVVYQGGWFAPELLEYAGLPKRLFRDGQVVAHVPWTSAKFA